jgi:maltose/maltodextrin transport system substrate-binding protein
MADMNIKTGARVFALSALAAMMISAPALAKIEEGKLVIWINGDKGYNGLAEVGKKFEKDTGIKVTVEHPDKLEEKFPQVAATGDGPDIIFWAHDRFGGYAQSGLLAEISPDKAFQDKLFPFTWDAVRYNGKLIAYPVAVEALSLIYNKDLVPNPPKTWEEIPALDKELKAKGKSALMFNLQEPYFTWPLIAADGGYAFKFENGKYDVKDVGVDSAGAKAGLTFLVDLIKNKHMNADTDYSIAEAAFNKGETAMTINGPWAWSNIDKSKINYGVTLLPTFKVGVTVQRPWPWREVDGKRLAHLLGFECGVVQHLMPQVVSFYRFADQRIFLLIARHHQQVVDHAVQTMRFRFDTLQLFALAATTA